MSKHQGDPYRKCDGCGVRDDDPDVVARVEQSVGNAFVSMEITNTVSGAEWEHDYCSACWCRIQAAAEGRAVPARVPNPFPRSPVCTCDVPSLGGACKAHPREVPWHAEMS